MTDEHTAITDQNVYLVYEHAPGRTDALRMVFEDGAETLREVIDYCTRLAESDSRIIKGEFHAANPGDEWLNAGDHYLVKRHAVGISHSLRFE